METLRRDLVIEWLRRSAAVLQGNKETLTSLDAAIGDADHGINMERGFKKVLSQLPTFTDKDIGTILKGTALALISSVGGASGPLYGSLFLKASTAVTGKSELGREDIGGILRSGLDGIVERGKAQPGDKTMIDALAPAVEAFSIASWNGVDIIAALKQSVAAAEHGMKATIPMLARKGRASYLGERSIGHQDPGATSLYLILKALYEVVSRDGG